MLKSFLFFSLSFLSYPHATTGCHSHLQNTHDHNHTHTHILARTHTHTNTHFLLYYRGLFQTVAYYNQIVVCGIEYLLYLNIQHGKSNYSISNGYFISSLITFRSLGSSLMSGICVEKKLELTAETEANKKSNTKCFSELYF